MVADKKSKNLHTYLDKLKQSERLVNPIIQTAFTSLLLL